VPERDVIEPVREDRAVQLVLRNGREPLVLNRGRKPVGHQHVVVILCQFDLVVSRPVILDPKHVRDQVKDRIADLHLLVPEPVRRRDVGVVEFEHRVGRGRVPGLDHAVVPGNHHERDAGRVEPFECFEHGRVGFCLRLYGIEEVARVDEDIRLLFDDRIYCRKEIVIHLFLAQVHSGLRIKPGKSCKTEMGVGDVDEFHRIFLNGILWDISGRGEGVKMNRDSGSWRRIPAREFFDYEPTLTIKNFAYMYSRAIKRYGVPAVRLFGSVRGEAELE